MKTKIYFLLILAGLSVSLANAQSLLWAATLTGSTNSVGDLTIDGAGNVISIGNFYGTTDFDPGSGTFNMTAPSAGEVHITKLDAAGNFIWAKSVGGSSGDAVCTDAAGNIYLTGSFTGTGDFDPGAGTYTMTSAGLQDIFVMKLDPNGNFIWAAGTGNSGTDAAYNIAVDASNVYVVGNYSMTVDFDPSASTTTLTGAGAFVWKLTQSGNLDWVKGFPADGKGVGVDATGNVYFSGSFTGSNKDFDPNAGTFNMSSVGSTDVCVAKLDALGNFVWAKRMGSVFDDAAKTLTMDNTGNVITSGWFSVTVDFDPGAGTANLTSAGSYDAFISKLDPSGNFVWAKRLGGTGTDDSFDISTDVLGNVYSTGYFSGSNNDFDPGAATYSLSNVNTGYDAYVSKLDASGNFITAAGFGSTSSDIGHGVAADASGNICAGGIYRGTVDFDPGAGVYNLSSSSSTITSSYILKMNGGPAGINESKFSDASVSVFPNPSNGKVWIKVKEGIANDIKVSTTDISGREIHSIRLNQNETMVDLNGEAKGIYFMIIESAQGRSVKKLVIQ